MTHPTPIPQGPFKDKQASKDCYVAIRKALDEMLEGRKW